MQTPESITEREYGAFQQAYTFFNQSLFNSSLPDVLVTLQRHAGAKGYFAPHRFVDRLAGEDAAHELALNPDVFPTRTDEEILSTLVHEMAHVWQQSIGTPPRRCYHDREWADKMKEVGLQPTTTGGPDGKETGQQVTHMIVPGGAFAIAYQELQSTGFQLNWQSRVVSAGERKKRAASKTKYTCPGCETNAWAKPKTALLCGVCYKDSGEVLHMKAKEEEEDRG